MSTDVYIDFSDDEDGLIPVNLKEFKTERIAYLSNLLEPYSNYQFWDMICEYYLGAKVTKTNIDFLVKIWGMMYDAPRNPLGDIDDMLTPFELEETLNCYIGKYMEFRVD